MSDPRLEREHELIADVVTAAITGDIDSANEAQVELAEVQMDCLPDPGRWRIEFPGKAREHGPITVVCPDCGRVVTTGGGVSFVEPGAWDERLAITWPTEEEDALSHHHSWPEDGCPALKWRWWRWKMNDAPWVKPHRKWMSYRWKNHDKRWVRMVCWYTWRKQRIAMEKRREAHRKEVGLEGGN